MADAVVLTISDSRSAGNAEDQSGPAAAEILAKLGLNVIEQAIVPDDVTLIRSAVNHWLGRAAIIVTTGGTGIAPRDVTPEAIAPLIDKELPGFGEIMRTGSFATTPLSIISRGGAGLAGRTLVIMLPGSPKGVKECLALIEPAVKHVLKLLGGSHTSCDAQ